MPSKPVSNCPSWCDPRACISHDSESHDHGTVGLTWEPVAGAETEVTVRTVRLDNTGVCGHVGDEMVMLRITDHYAHTFTETDLDPADARMLAAALLVEVERVEAKRRMAPALRCGEIR